MTAERVARWARVLVASGTCWLVAALGAAAAGLPERAVVVLALYGFVLHTVFGKAYSLVPTYFDRDLTPAVAPAVQTPLSIVGTLGLAVAAASPTAPPLVETTGASLWTAGVAVFLGAICWTVRTNPTGAATATGEAKADRRPVDRLANAAVPVVLAYLALGSYALLAGATPLPPLLDGYAARASHLLAAGTGALLLFAVGFRLLPRFLVSHPPRPLVPVVLGAGAVGPALLAVGLPSGPLVYAGAAAESVAVLGFATSYLVLFSRSERSRVGFYGVLAGVTLGVAGVGLGLTMAVGGVDARLATVHARTNLLGFLGVTIVGVSYQFYPPTVGRFPGASDRTALAAIGALAGGLGLQIAGALAGVSLVGRIGEVLALAGGLTHATLLLGLFVERAR